MYFEECDTGDYRIYAGALERPKQYGYVAAVVVVRVRGKLPLKEAYRNENLAGGFAWASPGEALRAAMKAGREMISSRMLALV